MHQPLERKGPAERGVNEQGARPEEEAGSSSESHSRKYSLIQDQARELTRLRQKVRLGRAVSSLLIQHVKNTVKDFEELLSSSKLDRSMEQYFRVQLANGRELAESLASKFSTDDYINKKDQRGQMLRTLSILRKMNKMGRGTEVLETRQDALPWTLFQIHSSRHAPWTAHGYPGCASSLPEEQEACPMVNVASECQDSLHFPSAHAFVQTEPCGSTTMDLVGRRPGTQGQARAPRMSDDSPAAPTGLASSSSSHSGARSAQPFYTPSGTRQLSRTPDPGHHGCSSPGDEMRPQKMNASGHLSSFSFHQPNSTSSGADLLEKNLVEIQNLRQRLEDSVCINDRLQERLEHALSNLDQGKNSGSISSTTSFSTAVSLPTFSSPRTEMSILETNQHLRSQLEESKQNFGDITVKFLTCKATAHSLAKQLQKYKCEECKDLAESVLKEDTPVEEGDLAEKTGTAAWLGKYNDLIQAQARELAHLRRHIQDGKVVCYLFTWHAKTTAKSFESLLRTTDIAYHQGQRFCEQLAQGSRLAESLASKLGPENRNDKEDEDGQKAVAPRLSRGLQKEEENEVLEDSLDEQYLTHSSGHDSPQPPSSDAFLCDVQKASSTVAVAKGEIQNLHQHLEEILFINGCLGDKLERHLSIADKGSSPGGPGCTSNLYREILESIVQLHNENGDVGEGNRSLQAHLNHVARGNN